MKKSRLPFTARLLRAVFKVLGVLWPSMAARYAYYIWFTTPRFKESLREKKWRELARSDSIVIKNKKVVLYRWGAVTPGYVLLIHGWSGRGPQLGSFVNALNKMGLGVISFDAPGHGQSAGQSTNIFEISETVNEIVRQFGQPKFIIAHSFGCMVAALAINKYQLAPEKLVTISCPTHTQYLLDGFRNYLGLNDKVIQLFNRKLFQQFGEDIYQLTSADYNLKGSGLKMLAVHDKKDPVVAWQKSDELTRDLANAQTLYTSGLGHLRILRDKQVIDEIATFLKE